MTPADVEDLKLRISCMEVRFAERWDAHDRRSEENWSAIASFQEEIKKTISSLATTIGSLPCSARAENTKSLWLNIKGIWTTISALAVALAGAFIAHLFGGLK